MIERLRAKYGENKPIFIGDIRNEFSEYSRPRVFQLIEKAIENDELARFDIGVYYIPTETIFGISKLNAKDVIERRFLRDAESVYGFYSGVTLLNSIGLTEQVPNVIEVVTNNETTRVRDIMVGSQIVRARRTRTEITKDNYKALQILELFNSIKLEDCKERWDALVEFVKNSRVTREEVYQYAVYYPAKAIKNYIMSGV